MAEASVWSPDSSGMAPLFYDSGEDEIGPGDEHEYLNHSHHQREQDELLADQPTEEDEQVVLRFKQGLKDATRDKQAMELWLARHTTSPCTTCKRREQCQRREGKPGCVPCETAHRRCSTTKAYIAEYAAGCADVSTETGHAMYEKFGTLKRTSGPRKKAVKMEVDVDSSPQMGMTVVELSKDAKVGGRKRKKPGQDAGPAELDSDPKPPLSRRAPAQDSQARFTPSLLLNSPAADGSYIAPMSVMLPSLSNGEYVGVSSNPRTSSSAPKARRSMTHAVAALPLQSWSTSTPLQNDLDQQNAQYNALKESYDRLMREKRSLEAEALRKESESRELAEEVKQLNGYRTEVADLKAEVTRLKRAYEEATSEMNHTKASGPTVGDTQERAQALQRHLTSQQMNHIRLSARVGQVELMLRRIVNSGTRGRDNKDALLQMALQELSSCLHDDMGSRMEHWNPFNHSGAVFRPEIVPSLPFNPNMIDATRREGEMEGWEEKY